MKRKLWFISSVFAMLLILAMWYVTDYGYSQYRVYYVERFGGPDTVYCRTLYGFGEGIEVEYNSIRYAESKEYHWWKYYLPPLKFGWIIIVFAIYQWLILIRKFRRKTKKTKQFAISVKSTRDAEQINDSQFDKPGGFAFDLKYYKLFTYIQIGLAVAIFIGNTLSVVISKSLKYELYSYGYAFESMQLNIEYIFPGVLFLTATLISVYCLNKYIELYKIKDKLNQRCK